MIYINSFLIAGTICLIGQIMLDNTKLTPGHITTILVVSGVILDTAGIYDKFITWAGGGALVPITSFGHLLIHGALEAAKEDGGSGLFTGMFSLTSGGIVSVILFSFIFALIFKPKD